MQGNRNEYNGQPAMQIRHSLGLQDNKGEKWLCRLKTIGFAHLILLPMGFSCYANDTVLASTAVTQQIVTKSDLNQTNDIKPVLPDEQAADDIKMVFAPRDINDPLESVLGMQLKALLLAVERGDADPAKSAGLPHQYVSNAQSVAVNIFINPDIAGMPIVDWLAAHDLKATWVYTPHWVAVRMPVLMLRQLVKEEHVARVDLSQLVTPAAAHEGVRASRAARWQNLGDIKGRGVRITVVDTFNPDILRNQRDAGEIPPAGRLNTARLSTTRMIEDGDHHGNNVLEILYDMAPEAQFSLYEPEDASEEEMASTIQSIRNADIVSISLGKTIQGYNDGKAASHSPVIQAFKAAHAAGTLVVASVGNSAQKHWSGPFRSHVANANRLNWNHNTFTNFAIDSAASDTDINVLRLSANNACIRDGTGIIIDEVVEQSVRMLGGLDQAYYVLRLVREGSDRIWRTVAEDRGPFVSRPTARRNIALYADQARGVYGTSDDPIRFPGESGSEFLMRADRSLGATGSSPGCDANSARYGVQVLRNVPVGATTLNHEPYIQLFSNIDLTLPVAQTSLNGSTASPWTLSVGAAYCDNESSLRQPAGGNCSDLNVASYSSRGPVVGNGGTKPLLLLPAFLPEINPALRLPRLPSIKPDLLGLTNFTTSLSRAGSFYQAFSGTSAAAPYVAGIAALMIERFGEDLKQKPDELKYALLQLASLREADVVSRGYPSTVSYDKGFGLLRLQREDRLEYRGCTASARINVPLMANQLDASDRSCDEPFTDGYDKTVRIRFLDSSGQVVMYPLGYPMVGIRNGPAGTLPTDLQGSGRQDVLFSFPYSDPGRGVPRIGSRDGWFALPNLKFVRIPMDSAGRTIEVTNPYSLKMQAQTINGVPIPIVGSTATAGEAIRESYPGRDTIVCNVGVTDSRCPSM